MMKHAYSVETIKPQLQITEDIPMHRIGWIVQRFGWAFLFAMMLAGGLGMFGQGPISKRTVRQPAFSVEFERFFRFQAPMEVICTIHTTDTADLQITFPETYLTRFEIRSMVPEPRNTTNSAGNITYHFEGSPRMVYLELVPQQRGTISGFIMVAGQKTTLTHLIFP